MSNTPVESFLKYLNRSNAFGYSSTKRPPFMIDQMQATNNCPLMLVAQALKWVSEHLGKNVNVLHDYVSRIVPTEGLWKLELASKTSVYGRKIILSIGGNPKELQFADIARLSLKTALNPPELQSAIQSDDNVIVFGSAQSAKSVVDNLVKTKAKKITLFYRSENSLTRHFQNHDELLREIEAVDMTPRNLLARLPSSTKAIYAIGFERRHIPIAGLPANYGYDKKSGEIPPGIFGIGMAFPEILPNEMGYSEYPVTAIWPFMKRLDKLMPTWISS